MVVMKLDQLILLSLPALNIEDSKMEPKVYFSYEASTGAFTGTGEADISPLEEGVFLFPANCTETSPPAFGPGYIPVFNSGEWTLQEDHRGEIWYFGAEQVVITEIGPVDPSLTREITLPKDPKIEGEIPEEEVTLQEYSANLRWLKETSGTTWNGFPVHTDRESQSKIMSEVMAINLGLRDEGSKWKFSDGEFRSVSNDEFMSLTNSVRLHVIKSFEEEEFILGEIKSGSITEKGQVDLVYSSGIVTEDENPEFTPDEP